jgi:hypothetical protein
MAQIAELLFHGNIYALILPQMLWPHFGAIFKINSSGHPAQKAHTYVNDQSNKCLANLIRLHNR